MEKIVILMSTYNGEKYIKEQITSILNQQKVKVQLVIRDDGSTDSTRIILEDFKNKNKNIDLLLESNIGCKKSFFRCAEYAITKYQDITFFAFSDQDDFWQEDKLISGIDALKKKELNEIEIPLLYFCPPIIVDSNLIPVNSSWKMQHYLTFGEACLIQPCAGCCMIFNKKSLSLFLMGNPNHMSLHDSWLYKSVLACGGIIIEDSIPHILYRQHENNVIGAGSLSVRWKRRIQNFTNKNCYRLNQIKELITTYSDIMPTSQKEIATYLSNYQNYSLCRRFHLIFNSKLKTKSKIHNLMFAIAIIFKRY